MTAELAERKALYETPIGKFFRAYEGTRDTAQIADIELGSCDDPSAQRIARVKEKWARADEARDAFLDALAKVPQ